MDENSNNGKLNNVPKDKVGDEYMLPLASSRRRALRQPSQNSQTAASKVNRAERSAVRQPQINSKNVKKQDISLFLFP